MSDTTAPAAGTAQAKGDAPAEPPKSRMVIVPMDGSHVPHRHWLASRHMRQCDHEMGRPKNESIKPDKVRYVCTSDTHNLTDNLPFEMPKGDVLIHAGDFSKLGYVEQVEHFNKWLGTLDYKIKIVIAGNHDLSFDPTVIDNASQRYRFDFDNSHERALKERGVEHPKDLLTNCIYIEDSEVMVAGHRIYGAPWSCHFGAWAFNAHRGEPILEHWNKIPEDIDILMTHGPANGYGDETLDEQHVGCVELWNTIQKRVKPKLHVFGHIHEGYGNYRDKKGCWYINCAMERNSRYVGGPAVNEPFVYDLPVREGFKKTDLDCSGQKNKKVKGTMSGISLE